MRSIILLLIINTNFILFTKRIWIWEYKKELASVTVIENVAFSSEHNRVSASILLPEDRNISHFRNVVFFE
jgi:hypothetical protein